MTQDRALWHHLTFQAHTRPQATAVLGPAGPVSYRELVHDVDALATELLERGLAPGAHVGLHFGLTYLHLLLILALDRIGSTSSSFPTTPDASTPLELPPQAGLSHVISAAAAPSVPPCPWITLSEQPRPKLGQPDAARLAALRRGAADVVRIAWSSGTTGGIKGAVITRAAQDHRLAARRWLHGLSARTRYFVGMPFSQPFGYSVPLATLSAGGLVILPMPASDFVALANGLGVTLTGATPAMLRELVERDPAGTRRLDTIEAFEVLGTHLPSQLAAAVRERLSPNFLLGYGTSEIDRIATGDTALSLADPTAVGFVVPWVEAEIVDPADRRVPPGQEGLVRVRGAGLATGYWRDAAATQANFRGGWFYPGDLGALEGNGLLRITGRAADMIVRDGVLLSPLSLEDDIRGVPGVRDVAVFPIAGRDGGHPIAAALVVEPAADAAGVRAAIAARLGARTPERMFMIDKLPVNAGGKVMRGELVNWALRRAGETAS